MRKKTILLLLAMLIPISFLYSQTAQELYKQGISHLLKVKNINSLEDLNHPDVKEALKIFKEIIQGYSETKWAELSRKHTAYTYYRGKDYNNAGTAFFALVEAYPDNDSVSDWKYILAKIDYESERYNDAEQKFRDLIEGQAESSRTLTAAKPVNKNKLAGARLMIGRCKLQQKEYEEAVEEFNNLISNYPKNPYTGDALAGIARAYFEQGNDMFNESKYDEALEYFNKVTKLYNENKRKYSLLHKVFSDAYFLKAEGYIKLGDKEKAKKIFEEITKEFLGKYKYKEAKKRLEELKE